MRSWSCFCCCFFLFVNKSCRLGGLGIRCCGYGKPYRLILKDTQCAETGIQFETAIQVTMSLRMLLLWRWCGMSVVHQRRAVVALFVSW